jgi:hypothetical protein
MQKISISFLLLELITQEMQEPIFLRILPLIGTALLLVAMEHGTSGRMSMVREAALTHL